MINNRLFQLLVVNFGIVLVYALQKKIAWRLVEWFDDAILRGQHDRELEFRRRPYPKPQHKNLYYREDSDWE